MLLPKPYIKRAVSGIGSSVSPFEPINIVIVGTSSFLFASLIYKELCNQIYSISILEPYYDQDKNIVLLAGNVTSDLNLYQTIVVHSICDTGRVLYETHKKITSDFPNSRIRNICMVNKLHNRIFDTHTDFSIIDVQEDVFVVGLGIGTNNEYRDLDSLYILY